MIQTIAVRTASGLGVARIQVLRGSGRRGPFDVSMHYQTPMSDEDIESIKDVLRNISMVTYGTPEMVIEEIRVATKAAAELHPRELVGDPLMGHLLKMREE